MDKMVTVLTGLGAGKKPRGIAEDIWGGEDVATMCTRTAGWLAGAALDTEGGGARRRRLARVCAPHRSRGVIGSRAASSRVGAVTLSAEMALRLACQ